MNKSLYILTALCLLIVTGATSQSVDTDLTVTYAAFDTATTYPELLQASNQFKLIAQQNPDYWLANYYAAWSIAILSFQETKKANKDPMLDEADGYFLKIEIMDSSNDEVAVLGALIAQARISVAPAGRHGKYGEIANKYFDLVKKINPNNPRMYFRQGISLFYTPKLFGGGAEKALPFYEKAETLFVNDSNDIHKPHWGKAMNEKMIKECKDKIGK